MIFFFSLYLVLDGLETWTPILTPQVIVLSLIIMISLIKLIKISTLISPKYKYVYNLLNIILGLFNCSKIIQKV